MAFSRGSVHSDSAKKEQIITEFFAKSLHIILESRAPCISSRNYSGEQVVLSSPSSSSSSSSSYRPRDKWFNLALRDCPAALENIDFWRHSNLDPMVVDVVLTEQNPDCLSLDPEDFAVGPKEEKVIERWMVVYESKKCGRETSSSGSGTSKRSSGNLHSLYKKSIVLLRSLYATVRLLPAYKLFRDLISSSQIQNYTLIHRVSSSVEPLSQKEEADMQRFGFTPVDTSCGRLCISVLYQGALSELNSEPSTPMSPQFIPDYVGSPLADPLKRLPSLPVSRSSPSYSPFSRRHSWSYDVYRASPPSVFASPSPTYSDSQGSIAKTNSHRAPSNALSHGLPGSSLGNRKYTGPDEYFPFSAFSPSPPVYSHPADPFPHLFRCESAPVRIPVGKGPSSALVSSSKQILPPSPPPQRGRRHGLKNENHSGSSGQFSPGKDESGRFYGAVVSSNSSPQVSVSRTSSRLSYQDDYDDTEFCHFAVDDDDSIDPGSRGGSFDNRRQPSKPSEHGGPAQVHKSHNAELGALVLMLNKAPPLRQDIASICLMNQPVSAAAVSVPATTSTTTAIEGGGNKPMDFQSHQTCTTLSNVAARKTTADALAELREYREVKEELVRRGGKKLEKVSAQVT